MTRSGVTLQRVQLYLLLVCSVMSVLAFSQRAIADVQKKIFILHSYESNHVCGAPQHEGVLRGLRENGFVPDKNLQVQVFAMDTKRRNTTEAQMSRVAEQALAAIRSFSPDVLVTLDDNAFRLVALRLADTGQAIVFSGMNTQPEKYARAVPWLDSRSHPGHNITGVIEKLHILTALKVQRKILGKLDTVFFISDTSPTGTAAVEQVHDEMGTEPHDFTWRLAVADSWEQYRKILLAACSDPEVDTIYPMALRLQDAGGTVYTAPEILRWTAHVCHKPSIPVNYAFVELGLMGGVGVDFEYMGWQAGWLAARILHGETPGEIPLEKAARYALVFNMARARALGITIPEDVLLAADQIYAE